MNLFNFIWDPVSPNLVAVIILVVPFYQKSWTTSEQAKPMDSLLINLTVYIALSAWDANVLKAVDWQIMEENIIPRFEQRFIIYLCLFIHFSQPPFLKIMTVLVCFVVRGQSPSCPLFSTASMLGWLRNSSPTTHRGAVRKDGANIPREWSVPECFTSSLGFNVPLYF